MRPWRRLLAVLARTGAPTLAATPAPTIQLPSGFRIETFASGLGAPRFLALSPSGDLYVSDDRGGVVYRISYAGH